MLKWEYRIFASHLDPAELVIILDESGCEGWELIAVVPVTDYQPAYIVEPVTVTEELAAGIPPEAAEVIPLEAFRYIFKRPTA